MMSMEIEKWRDRNGEGENKDVVSRQEYRHLKSTLPLETDSMTVVLSMPRTLPPPKYPKPYH